MPFFSVIIPTYNRANFIGTAVASVLSQTFTDYEMIVIDDGSTDHTDRALASYRGKIDYIKQNNAGVSAARNAGINAARGEWLAFLDSDDEWLPGYLACQHDGIRRYPTTQTHTTNAIHVLSNGIEVNAFEHSNLMAEFRSDEMIIARPLQFVVKYRLTSLQPTVVHRQTFLEAGLFDPSLNIAEDYDFFCRMALSGAFRFSTKALVRICRREEETVNLTSQLNNRGIYSFESFAKVHQQTLHSDRVNRQERFLLRKALGANKRALGNLMIRSGRRQDAQQLFKEAVRIDLSFKSLLKYWLSFLPAATACHFVLKGRDIRP